MSSHIAPFNEIYETLKVHLISSKEFEDAYYYILSFYIIDGCFNCKTCDEIDERLKIIFKTIVVDKLIEITVCSRDTERFKKISDRCVQSLIYDREFSTKVLLKKD